MGAWSRMSVRWKIALGECTYLRGDDPVFVMQRFIVKTRTACRDTVGETESFLDNRCLRIQYQHAQWSPETDRVSPTR